VRLLPASPRKRRRLAWAAAALLAIAALAAAIVGGGRGESVPPEPESRGKGSLPPAQPSTVKRTPAELEAPLAVAAKFIRTAVERRDVNASWGLVTADLKAGYTRRAWARGDIPIVPFPAGQVRWVLDYSFADSVGFQVALFPRAGTDVRAAVFLLDLKAVKAGNGKRWLVSAFTPTPQQPKGVSGSPLSRGPERLASDSQVLGAAWLLVPLALLGLAILIPLVLGISYWFRVKRAERDFAKGKY
jgi:hypothetical protein